MQERDKSMNEKIFEQSQQFDQVRPENEER